MDTKRISRRVRFPRLRELRERRLGWQVIDLAAKLENRPSIASIYRLEAGEGLRASNVRRIFNVINEAVGNSLDPAAELIFDE